MADEAAEFWSDFERETGEKVVAKAIGEFYEVEDATNGLWGLLILTDKSFRFKHMPSDNWLSSIFKRAARSAKPREPVELTVAIGDIASVNAPQRSFFARLFGPAFPRFAVVVRASADADASASEKRYVFSVDTSGGFLLALEKAARLGSPPAE